MRIFKNSFVFVIICIVVLVTGCFGKNSESLDVFKIDNDEQSQQNEITNTPTIAEDEEYPDEPDIQTAEPVVPVDEKDLVIITEQPKTAEIVISKPVVTIDLPEETITPSVEITIGDAVVFPIEDALDENAPDETAYTPAYNDSPIVFADAKFESIVRQFLGNYDGDIMQSSLSKIKYADVFMGLTFSYMANPSKEEKVLINLKEEDYPGSFDDVKYFTGLEYLSIPFIPVVDLSFISGMTNLKYLYMYKASLSDLSPLSSLINMEELNLAACEINDISVLTTMTSLKKLDLSENTSINDYSVLKSFKNLETLKLSGNQISSINFIADSAQILELDLSKNNISDVTPVSNLKNLISLNLSKNNISDIGSLAHLNNLKKLYLTGNIITDINSLGDISRFSTLKYDN